MKKLFLEIILVGVIILIAAILLSFVSGVKKVIPVKNYESPKDYYINQKSCEVSVGNSEEDMRINCQNTPDALIQKELNTIIAPKESIINLELNFADKTKKNTYVANFEGNFTLQNPYDKDVELSFVMPVPGNGGLVSNLMLTVDGKEPKDVIYTLQYIKWTGKFKADETKNIKVSYCARGIGGYYYIPAQDVKINKLDFNMVVKGQDKLTLASNTLPVTEENSNTGEHIFKWNLNNLVTNMNIGVELSDRTGTTNFYQLFRFAPFLWFLFLIGIIISAYASKLQLKPLSVFLISIAYGLFYPLVLCLNSYFEAKLAFLSAFLICGLLIINYLKVIANTRFAIFAGFGLFALFIGLPGIAIIFPYHAGIIITLACIIAVALLMKVTAGINSRQTQSEISQ